MATFMHVPVLAAEVLNVMRGCVRVVDCTAGGGGHAVQLALAGSRVLALDIDGAAVRAARARLTAAAVPAERAVVRHASYVSLSKLLHAGAAPWPRVEHADGAADGILVDLGSSSYQLDPAVGRGFSLRDEVSMDMHFFSPMDEDGALKDGVGGPAAPALRATDLVNGCSEGELTLLLRDFGEEPRAAAIARAIISARPLTSASELARVVGKAARSSNVRRGPAPVTAAAGSRHPATRTLQALRIAVNGELDSLQRLLADAPLLLAPGGCFCAITFHSLEDRLVKSAFRDLVRGGGYENAATESGSAFVRPSAAEVAANPRARSATLRAVRRLPKPQSLPR